MTLIVEIDETSASYSARPEHGRPVTFCVSRREINVAKPSGWYKPATVKERFVVHLKNSDGMFSQHVTLEAACKAAMSRARRYDSAYSKQRRSVAA